MPSALTVPLVKGFRDVVPTEYARWLAFERIASEHFARYGFLPIGLPIVERLDLFARSLGDASDVVSKEMFAFTDRDGTAVTLRPEATASTARAYLASGPGNQGGAARYWYVGPMFRRERPQKGRFRQFQQIGVEAFGDAGPMSDAEILVMLMDYLEACAVREPSLLLGSLGDEACRPAYRARLYDFANARRDALCETCRERLERNPLRLLDCKSAGCNAALQDAPVPLEHLCGECDEHFAQVRRTLDLADVPYVLAPRLVRGLDYYSRTAFEVVAGGLGSQNAVGGGGRYDGLVAGLGGPSVPGFGFAIGVDRLAMSSTEPAACAADVVAVLPLSGDAQEVALAFGTRLRRGGWSVRVHSPGRSVKAMLRLADREGARLAVLLGPDELATGRATVRDLRRRRDHPAAFPVDVDAGAFAAWLSMVDEEEEKA